MVHVRKIVFGVCFLFSALGLGQEFAVGSFCQIVGLKNSNAYNGRPAMVLEKGQADSDGKIRQKVLIWSNNENPAFIQLSVKEANLIALPPQQEIEKTAAEVVEDLSAGVALSAVKIRDLTAAEKQELDIIQRALIGLGTKEELLGENEPACRVIGAYLAANYGFSGMLYVAELNHVYTPYIERAWDFIGAWRA